MSILLIIYVIVGPGAWLLFVVGILMARQRMGRLRRPALSLPTAPPEVAILIPAKDEGQAVRKCLDSVLALDYPNFSVVAIDDRSSDSTGAIIDEYAARPGKRLRALHIPKDGLSPGWLGKCNALATAARDVSAEWILFVDSDVQVARDALSACLALAVGRGYDAVSILTRLECYTFWEKLILPLAAAAV
jgi:glycosyltransferase involved in cell wall biosynthesis